jgi:hypothetical protein
MDTLVLLTCLLGCGSTHPACQLVSAPAFVCRLERLLAPRLLGRRPATIGSMCTCRSTHLTNQTHSLPAVFALFLLLLLLLPTTACTLRSGWSWGA